MAKEERKKRARKCEEKRGSQKGTQRFSSNEKQNLYGLKKEKKLTVSKIRKK